MGLLLDRLSEKRDHLEPAAYHAQTDRCPDFLLQKPKSAFKYRQHVENKSDIQSVNARIDKMLIITNSVGKSDGSSFSCSLNHSENIKHACSVGMLV